MPTVCCKAIGYATIRASMTCVISPRLPRKTPCVRELPAVGQSPACEEGRRDPVRRPATRRTRAVGWSSLSGLPWIRQEVLILAGNDDPIIPMVDARIMKFLLLHASFHINDDGHLGLVTKADELGPLVSSFLRRVR